jgi:hypothetical protein
VVTISGRYEHKCTVFTTLRERISSFNANNKHTLYTHNLANDLQTIKYKLLLATYFRIAEYAWKMAAVHPRQDLHIVDAIKSSHVILVNVPFQSKEIWVVKIQVVWDATLYLGASGSKPHSLTPHKTWVFSSTGMRTSISQRFSASPHSAKVHSGSLSDSPTYNAAPGGGGGEEYKILFYHFESQRCCTLSSKRFSSSVGEVYTPVCDECTVIAVTTLKWQQINIM